MCLILLSIILLISSRFKSIERVRCLVCCITLIKHSAVFLLLISLTISAADEEWILSGTFISDQHSHAMFIDANGDELLIPLGKKIQGCDVVNILQESAKIQCSDKTYKINLRTSVGNLALQSQQAGTQIQNKIVTLPKVELAEYVKQRQKLVSEIGFLPVIQEQKIKGYAISKIRPNTFASSLGLYNGDIVTAVNGVAAAEVTEFFQMLDSLSQVPVVSIQVRRYGRSLEVTYLIE